MSDNKINELNSENVIENTKKFLLDEDETSSIKVRNPIYNFFFDFDRLEIFNFRKKQKLSYTLYVFFILVSLINMSYKKVYEVREKGTNKLAFTGFIENNNMIHGFFMNRWLKKNFKIGNIGKKFDFKEVPVRDENLKAEECLVVKNKYLLNAPTAKICFKPPQ